jgi:hypothetical protein
MRHALLDGVPVKAEWAAGLPNEKFVAIQTQFTCVGCKARAYLNRGSRYQDPYFASKDHSDDCTEAYQGTGSGDTALVQANTVVIIVGKNVAASEQPHAMEDVKSRRRTTIAEGEGTSEIRARRGVDAILQQLIADPEFSSPARNIVVGKFKTPASEFFVPFLQLGEQHAGRIIGVWGEADSFRTLTSITFLNRADGKGDIRIRNQVFDRLKQIYKISSSNRLEGAKFLLIGTFDMHLQCYINDVREIALKIKNVE